MHVNMCIIRFFLALTFYRIDMEGLDEAEGDDDTSAGVDEEAGQDGTMDDDEEEGDEEEEEEPADDGKTIHVPPSNETDLK